MEENFDPVARTRANYYTPGSPVQFVCVELLKGEASGDHAVCLTFKNVGTEPLTGFIIHFKCKDASGQILCEDDFYYEQLNVQPGELFGADDAVFVCDTPVSSVEIEQDRAFLNGRGVDLRNYKRVRLQAPRVLPGSIARTLQTRNNNKMLTCVPQDTENGWFCACGAFHPNEEAVSVCSECGGDCAYIKATLTRILEEARQAAEQQQRVKHYFVGNHHIEDYYSAAQYEADVMNLLQEDIFKNHDVALLTGGSMMYIDAVCKGIDDIPTVRDDIRTWMKQRLEEEGLEALVEELHKMDPEHWAIVDRKNPRRVVHALEICHQTGKTYTSFRTAEKKQRPFRIIKIGLNRDRAELYDRINQRVLMMMDEGLEAEARSVYPQKGLTSLRTVGYKEMFSYFDGEIDRDEAIRQIQSHSREYMRKQLTWFKRDTTIQWFHPEQQEEIIRFIDEEI